MPKPFSTKIDFDFWMESRDSEGFDRLSRDIVRRWEMLQQDVTPKSKAGAVGAIDWLMVVTYQLIEYLLADDEFELVSDRLEAHGLHSADRPHERQHFQLGIRALFAHRQGSITDSQRERIYNKCWHGYRHYIPPILLPGFFSQIPSAGITYRIKDSRIEEQFRWWLIAQRATRDVGDCKRGAYPSDVERDVKKLRKALRNENPDEYLRRICVLPSIPA